MSLSVVFHIYNVLTIMINGGDPSRSEKSFGSLGAMLLGIYIRWSTQSEAWYENFLLFLCAMSGLLNLCMKRKEAVNLWIAHWSLTSAWICDKFKISEPKGIDLNFIFLLLFTPITGSFPEEAASRKVHGSLCCNQERKPNALGFCNYLSHQCFSEDWLQYSRKWSCSDF